MSNTLPLYSASTIANLFNLSERRVQQLAAEHIIPKPKRGKYELIGAVRGYIRYLKDRASGVQSAASEYQAERLRYITAQADEMENRVDQLRNDVVPIDEVAGAWERFSGVMIVRFMLLPHYLQTQFELTDDERKLIEAEFKTVLENLDQPFTHLMRQKP